MKKIVILDFDGTIADTKPVILNTFHRTFDAMHLPQHSDEEIAATIGLPLVEAFPVLEPMDKEKAAECTATYREIFEDVNREIGVPMFPHVAETLRLLHAKGLHAHHRHEPRIQVGCRLPALLRTRRHHHADCCRRGRAPRQTRP